MDDLLMFLGIMSALSASAETMTTQMRRRFNLFKLEHKKEIEELEEALHTKKLGKMHANIHLLCGLNGALLAALGNIHPLSMLRLEPLWSNLQPWLASSIDFAVAGVLVAYGGPWFHEVLGILREYKKSLRGATT
ncbi:hypothetical protein [Tumebacillus permanentifrigoris]|uniref:Uncharacterized protein n=1 Tax=Tumebacillus permanentifrigoris TaxID=378543 RepID=A0A316D430_9BACL|nr:hypothetical protein [Tumebacillus permanentifrigoris]PWK06983.1 hypothetical protein C7459_11851 [Tumebacillus permanentifrigoris]